jgi:hypothetical protein
VNWGHREELISSLLKPYRFSRKQKFKFKKEIIEELPPQIKLPPIFPTFCISLLTSDELEKFWREQRELIEQKNIENNQG